MIAALLLVTTLSSPRVVAGTPPPVVVMVRTAGTPAFLTLQDKLRDEVTLLLDSFMVISTGLEVDDFAKLPLAEQLTAVLPLSRANDAVAVVWLAEPLPGQLMLHLVAMGTGRTLVRTIELDRKSQSIAALALMLRELLGTAFLYEPPQAVAPEVRSVVKEVQQQMPLAPERPPPPPPAPAPPPAEARAQLAAFAALEAGVGARTGPDARGGFSLVGTLRAGPVWFGLEPGLLAQRSVLPGGVWLTSLSVPLLVSAALRLGGPALSFGPRVAAGGELSWTTVTPGSPEQLFTFGPLGVFGLEAVAGTGRLHVALRAEVLVRSRRAEAVAPMSDELLWQLPGTALRLAVGVSWEAL